MGDIIQDQIELIDESIARIEKSLKKHEEKVAPIKERRDKLRAARRALTGGTRLTGGGGSQIRQEDIVRWLRDHPGSSLSLVTEAVGGTTTQISSHLSRGKNERFLNFEGKWWVRDPKNGLNTEADCQNWLRENDSED